jgi:cytochrome c55X
MAVSDPGYGRCLPAAHLAIAIALAFVAVLTAAVEADRARELVRLVRQDCGACHGMTLAGGLGPSLQPAALRDRPPEALVQTIVHGRPGTPMPPWGPFLSEPESRWIVERLLTGFPAEGRAP